MCVECNVYYRKCVLSVMCIKGSVCCVLCVLDEVCNECNVYYRKCVMSVMCVR